MSFKEFISNEFGPDAYSECNPFGREDDLLLWEGYKKLGNKWVEISMKSFQSTRTVFQIEKRWYSMSFKEFISNEFGPDAYSECKSSLNENKLKKPSAKRQKLNHKDAERAEKKKAKDAERPKRAEKKKARAKKAMSPSTGPSSIEPSKTIELNSILLAANSSISSTGIFNDKKFYFHAGVNNNDNGVTAGEAPSFNFRTEDNIVYTFPRWSRSFIAMNHDIRGAAPSSKLFHGAGRDTKRLNGLGQHSTDDCCVLVFTVAGKTTTAAVQFLEETTVNKEQLKVELQKVIDTVKQNWKSFDDIILPWFTTTKHYVAVALGRDNQNGNGHIKLNIPISVNTKGHCRNYLKENSLTMNEISCTVYCPILCGMIEHVNHRGNTRIQFYSADSGFMPLHQDHGGERAHEYIKCSYMETGVGLTYSGRDSN